MASSACFETSVQKGSDLINDFCCSTCEEDDVSKEATFYCDKCVKFYCNGCVKLHNQLHRKHSVAGRQDMKKWPVAKAIDDTLEQCHVHKDEKLKLLCDDHQQILCTVCHVYNHQKCNHVVLIADKLKSLQKDVEFLQLSNNLKKLRDKINQEKHKKTDTLHSVQNSFQKVLDEIWSFRKEINDALDRLEKTTKQELDTMLTYLKTSLQTDIETLGSAHQKIQHLHDEFLNIEKKSPVVSFILYTKCKEQSSEAQLLLQSLACISEFTMSFSPDTTIINAVSGFTRLGKVQNSNIQSKHHFQYTNKSAAMPQDMSNESATIKPTTSNPNTIFSVTNLRKYFVSMERENECCCISGMSETASGELLALDSNNKKVKLLSPTYRVVAHYDLPYDPWAMCNTDSDTVAVAMSGVSLSQTYKIHFIKVKNKRIVLDRKLNLEHSCKGIAHNRGKLYINSDSALYQYNIDGSERRQIYKDTSDQRAVGSCAVSPDGERIYVSKVSITSKQLLILSSDGKVLSAFTDPALQFDGKGYGYLPVGLHVTDSGQVLVCGVKSNTILQVDSDGKQRLAKVVKKKNGVDNPISVYFSRRTSKLIVGLLNNNQILVFDAE